MEKQRLEAIVEANTRKVEADQMKAQIKSLEMAMGLLENKGNIYLERESNKIFADGHGQAGLIFDTVFNTKSPAVTAVTADQK